MSSPFVVRRLVVEDWWHLRAVRLAMLLDAPLAFGSTYAREAAFSEETWRERASGRAWLAWRGDLPVGSVTLWSAPDRPDDEVWLVGMWVAPHARRSGVADGLVTTALDEARASGIARVVLEVAEDNVAARRAYSRLGFVETGAAGPSHTHPDVRELEMGYDLGDEHRATRGSAGQGPGGGG